SPLYLTVKSDLTLTLGDDPVSRDGLGGTLDAAAQSDKDTRIFLRADKAGPYGEVIEVMNLLRAAGYLKVALVGLEETPGFGSQSRCLGDQKAIAEPRRKHAACRPKDGDHNCGGAAHGTILRGRCERAMFRHDLRRNQFDDGQNAQRHNDDIVQVAEDRHEV